MKEGDGKLDVPGHLDIEFDVPAPDENDLADYQYRLEAQVTDASRRTIDGSATMIATRGSVIASAIPDRYVFSRGDTARIAVKTTDYQGRPVPAKLSLKFVLSQTVNTGTNETPQYTPRESELSAAEITTDQQGEATYNYQITTPGSISIKTAVHENEKRFVSLVGYLWVVSADNQWMDSPYFNENTGAIKLVADKKSYQPGETAHVLAILPEEHPSILVTTERNNVLSAWKVNATGKTVVLDVPIEKHYAPNVFLAVTFVKDGDMYTSDKRLVVPARDKILNLEIISNKEEYKPREISSYTILARKDGIMRLETPRFFTQGDTIRTADPARLGNNCRAPSPSSTGVSRSRCRIGPPWLPLCATLCFRAGAATEGRPYNDYVAE